jgi:hypothetical protein
VNRWADQHAAALAAELDDGEQLLVAARVALARRSRAGATFPVPGRIFVLGLSDRRLLFWRASRWFGRPGTLATSVEMDQVVSLDPVRRLGTLRLRVTLATGSVLLLEPTWGGSVRALGDTFQALRTHR